MITGDSKVAVFFYNIVTLLCCRVILKMMVLYMGEYPRIDRIDSFNSTRSQQPVAKGPLPYQQRGASRIRLASQTHEKGIRGAPIVTVSYFNYFERDVVVTSRHGTPIVIPPLSDYNGDQFIVCISHTMPRVTMERALDAMKCRPNPDDPETHYWIRAYEAALYNANLAILTASVEYVIYHRDICDAGGRCYMPDVDLLVEWVADHGAVHPFDKIKRDESTLHALVPGVGTDTLVFMIKAVDNAHQTQRGTRYINLGGDIHTIPIERDLGYDTGVHVVSRSPLKDGEMTRGVVHRSYTFEEADDKFGLHRTVEDAIKGGPITDMAKTILERDAVIKRLRESEIRGSQIEDEAELIRLRNEGARHKAEQDLAASKRRNYVEWAKTGAAILGALITVYGIIVKLTTKS